MRASSDTLLYQEQHGVVQALLGDHGIDLHSPPQAQEPPTQLWWLFCTPKSAPLAPTFTGRFIPYHDIVWCERIELGVYTLRIVFEHRVVAQAVAMDADDDLSEKVLQMAYGQLIIKPRVLVVVNPHGGKGHASHIYHKQVLPVLRAAHAQVTFIETKHAEHATEIAKDLEIANYDYIACCSGDGIPHEIVNGLYLRPDRKQAFDQIAITQLPCGSGNAMTWSTHATSDPVDATLSMLKLTRVKADAMAVTQLDLSGNPVTKLSFLTQTYGIIADADIGTEHLRWMGALRFDIATAKGILARATYPCDLYVDYACNDKRELVRALAPSALAPSHPKPEATDYTLRGPPLDKPVPLLWSKVAGTDKLNVLYAGKYPYILKDVLFFPTAQPDDGTIDLLLTSTEISVMDMNGMFSKVHTGEHIYHEKMGYSKVYSYRLVPRVQGTHYLSVDGESFPLETLQVEVLPQAVTVLVHPEGVNNAKFIRKT